MNPTPSERARRADAQTLARALQSSREKTLALFEAYVAALGPELTVPYNTELNPPRWEAGHIAWFQEFWISRNQQRARGLACNPAHPRPAGRMREADHLYNSSEVPHPTRWQLPLPDRAATRAYLDATLGDTLALLQADADGGQDLYFYQLALFHEDMHGEAGIYMAQALDIDLPEAIRPVAQSLPLVHSLALPANRWRLGWGEGSGFAFDNELPPQDVDLAAFTIDSAPVSWRRFLPAVEENAVSPPRYLRKIEGIWMAQCFGRCLPLDLDAAAEHITWHQAQSWCRWAGRRLPSEAEWEYAAISEPEFGWGQVWEWTGSRFAPFPGFVAHPYRDYSRFGFEEHRYVLKGASRATDARMAHPRYRNFFQPERADIYAGFRSCAV